MVAREPNEAKPNEEPIKTNLNYSNTAKNLTLK